MADLREGSLTELGLQPLEDAFGVAGVAARCEHAESSAADAARQVVVAGRLEEHPCDPGEHVVGGEMADAGVDRRQPVDVDDEERQRPPRPAGARDLALEQRVEGAPVVDPCQRVELRDGIRLAELERGLEGGPGPVDDVLERGDVGLAEAAVRRARQDGEHARSVGNVEERHGEPRADRVPARRRLRLTVERDLERAGAAVVGDAHPADLRHFRLRQPHGRQDGFPLRSRDDRDRGVDRHPLPRDLEHAHDSVLGQRVRGRGRCGCRGRCLGGHLNGLRRARRHEVDPVVQRLRELAEPVVVAAEHDADDLLLTPQEATGGQEEQGHAEHGQDDGCGVDSDGHRSQATPRTHEL